MSYTCTQCLERREGLPERPFRVSVDCAWPFVIRLLLSSAGEMDSGRGRLVALSGPLGCPLFSQGTPLAKRAPLGKHGHARRRCRWPRDKKVRPEINTRALIAEIEFQDDFRGLLSGGWVCWPKEWSPYPVCVCAPLGLFCSLVDPLLYTCACMCVCVCFFAR